MLSPTVIPLADLALRSAALLACAGLAVTMLGRAPARVRGVVWAAALVGSLAVPICTPVVPSFQVPLPAGLARLALLKSTPVTEVTDRANRAPRAVSAPTQQAPEITRRHPDVHRSPDDRRLLIEDSIAGQRLMHLDEPADSSPASGAGSSWPLILVVAWATGLAAVLAWQIAGGQQIRRLVRRARKNEDELWQRLLARECRAVGLTRLPRLVFTQELPTPATWGLVRPVVILPIAAATWIHERREVVLRHELVHVVRHDWAVRSMARLACAVYWFNPLVWWAWRRLNLEQELACDQEVVALGTRPSIYASHLLNIARAARPRVAVAGAALEMARRSHMEGRIMSILDPRHIKRVGLLALAPAALLTLALAPALAAIQPSIPHAAADAASGVTAPDASRAVVKATPRTRQILTEIRELERVIEVEVAKIGDVEASLQPEIDEIERLSEAIEREHEALAHDAVAARLEPLEQQLQAIEEEMQPLHRRLDEVTASLGPLEHNLQMTEIDAAPLRAELEALSREIAASGNRMPAGEAIDRLHELMEPLHESVARMHEQMEPHHAQLQEIHQLMEPYHRRMEEIHLQMEPVHEELEKMHDAMQPELERLEALHERMEPFHQRMDELQTALEPLTDKIDVLAQELERELVPVVRARLEQHLGSMMAADAPWDEAAQRLVDHASSIHLDDDDIIELSLSRREARTILTDLMAPARRQGTSDSELEAAIQRAVNDIRDLEIVLD